jgi:hypothetical protein
MAQDYNDIYSIVERLAILEGRITPTGVKKGLNAQQRSVPQLPALFKPKDISPVLGAKEKKHPMAGYMVGDSVENDREPVEEDAGMSPDGVSPSTKEFTSEDVLEKVTKSFKDFLKSVADEVKQDADIQDKTLDDTDLKDKDKKDRALVAKESAPVQTVTNESGIWMIHETGASSFAIRHGNRELPTRFKNLDEACLALEMFNIRRRKPDETPDYIDEA